MHCLNNIKVSMPKIYILAALTGMSLAVSGCFSHTKENTREWNSLIEAKILCAHYNNMFEGNEQAFNLARYNADDELMNFCIYKTGLVLPDEKNSDIDYPKPHVKPRPRKKIPTEQKG
jgi:hypothetical protein